MRFRSFIFCALCVLTAAPGPTAYAQPYPQSFPTKPVRIIVPFAPGGGTDTIARTLSQKLTEAWGQSVIVENRPGAGGLIGFESVLKSPADGYTLGLGTISTLAIIPLTQAKPRYDPLKDYTAITLISTVPYMLAAHPSLPAHNLAEFVKLARGKPGQISYGTPGYATGIHLTAEYLSSVTGIKLIHVPYKGDAPALVDLFAGQISTAVLTTIITGQHVRSGRVRGVAMLTARRTKDLPDVPTAIEAGYAIESQSWQGICVRAGTPPDIVKKLNTDIVRVLNLPEVRANIEGMGNTVTPGTPDEFEKFISAETNKWRKVITSAGIRID